MWSLCSVQQLSKDLGSIKLSHGVVFHCSSIIHRNEKKWDYDGYIYLSKRKETRLPMYIDHNQVDDPFPFKIHANTCIILILKSSLIIV